MFVSVSIVFPRPRHSIATAERQCGHVPTAILIGVPQDGHSTDRDSINQKGSILLSIGITILQVLCFLLGARLYPSGVLESSISDDTTPTTEPILNERNRSKLL